MKLPFKHIDMFCNFNVIKCQRKAGMSCNRLLHFNVHSNNTIIAKLNYFSKFSEKNQRNS